jgi:hypothetical protein
MTRYIVLDGHRPKPGTVPTPDYDALDVHFDLGPGAEEPAAVVLYYNGRQYYGRVRRELPATIPGHPARTAGAVPRR